ncbi:CsbD family protein [Clostridium tagluense]|nr:CsbD family protein [Clostridium tagluense]MCB2300154.1 CsbD family protein [Clostridium tagluense]
MLNLNNKVENAKDKVIGKTKESVGRATGSQEMELKGKLQYQKGDLKEKLDRTKEKITEKYNDTLNKKHY